MVRRGRDEDMSDIEDATHSQRTNNDDAVEDDDEPRQKKKSSIKKPKKEKKPIINREGDVEEDEGDDDDERIDVDNFKDQALTKINGQTLKGLMHDWEQIVNKTHSSSEAMVIETAISLADNLNDDADAEVVQEALDKLDGTLRQIIDLENDLKTRQESVNDIYQLVAQGEEVADAYDRYITAVNQNMEASMNKTSRQKYMKNEQYIRFKQEIFSAQNEEGKGMPPMTEFIPKEDGDESDDDDIEMGGVALELKDPITLTYLEDPVTSTDCGHSFSRKSLQDYCQGVTKPCPNAGCQKKVSFAACKPNKTLERAVQQALKRQRRAEEHDDAEEIDD